MACESLMQCDLVYGFLKCALPQDTINVDLKVHTLNRIHTFRKDYKTQTTKCHLWGTEVQPYPLLKKKMFEFMWYQQNITTPFANRPYQPKPTIAMKKWKLAPLTRPNRRKLSPTKKNQHKETSQSYSAKLGIHHQWKVNPGSQGFSIKCINQPAPLTRKPANGHSVQTLTHFTCSPCKDHRTLKVLWDMHHTR